MGVFDGDDGSLGGGIFGEVDNEQLAKRVEKIEDAVNDISVRLHETLEQIHNERAQRAAFEQRLRQREDEHIVQLKKNSRPILREYTFTRSNEPWTQSAPSRVTPQHVQVSMDGPIEIVDVMCDREDVTVEIMDAGSQRIVARLTGPWLRRREVALAELAKIAADAIAEGRQASDIIVEAIQSAGGLVQPQWIPPSSAISLRIEPLTDAARADTNIRAWVRAVQWVNL